MVVAPHGECPEVFAVKGLILWAFHLNFKKELNECTFIILQIMSHRKVAPVYSPLSLCPHPLKF